MSKRLAPPRRRRTGTEDEWRAGLVIPLLLVLVTAFTFLPAVRNGFVLWDDDRMFLDNRHYRGLGWEQLAWMFTTLHMWHYMPLTWVSLGLDYVAWGMAPAGYHLTSIGLHVANTLVFYRVAVRLLGLARPGADVRAGAAVAALLFGVHPLRVESVAWATERRDVLCGLFFLAAILAYLRARAPVAGEVARPRRWAGLALAAGVAALLSKAMAVSLPLVLLVLDVYPLRRLGREGAARLLAEKVPLGLASAAASVIALVAVVGGGNAATTAELGGGGRLAVSLYALAFYLVKTLVPVGLSPLYELDRHGGFLRWPFWLAGALVAAVTAFVIARRRRWPALAAVWAAYVVVLLPVLAVVQNGPQIAADRYTYLACLGVALLAGGGVVALRARTARPAALAYPIAAIVVLVLVVLTWRQIDVWRDSETMWGRVLALDPRATVARNNLAAVRIREGRLDEAERLLAEAVAIRPDYALAWFNRGRAHAAGGRHAEAIAQFRAALAARPDLTAAENDWGLSLIALDRPEEAIVHFDRVLRRSPRDAAAHSNRGLALRRLGRGAEAMAQYRAALALDPDFAEAHFNWGYALAEEQQYAEAATHFEEALRLRPEWGAPRAALAALRGR